MTTKPEATGLSDEDLRAITARTVCGATSNTTSQDRVVLLTEVRRLRAENARQAETIARMANEHLATQVLLHTAYETIAKLTEAMSRALFFAGASGASNCCEVLREALKEEGE